MQGLWPSAVISIKPTKRKNMKRTFKTLGFFLSALFLLAACSSDDEDFDVSNIKTNELFIKSDKGNSSLGLAHEPYGWKGKGVVYELDGTVHMVYNMTFFCNIQESNILYCLAIDFEDDSEMNFADLKPGDTYDTNDFKATVAYNPTWEGALLIGTTATSGRLHVIDKKLEDGKICLTLQIDNFKFDAIDKTCIYTINGTIVYKIAP